ncbi:MAG: hypothetical protein HYZ28_06955 [Myxococcales bacterium]|nr:hypothetical protein [Myxococcales bacterium]
MTAEIDFDEYQEELRRRRAALGEQWERLDPSQLTHKPRDPMKRQWLEEHGLLTTPREAPGPWRPKFRKDP